MLKLIFFVPESHLESVKEAIFEVGAGRLGNYDCCCWQVLGQGQFRALSGSQPFIGKENQLEKVMEYKVEMVVEEALIEAVVTVLKSFHPYETPAYEVYQLVDV